MPAWAWFLVIGVPIVFWLAAWAETESEVEAMRELYGAGRKRARNGGEEHQERQTQRDAAMRARLGLPEPEPAVPASRSLDEALADWNRTPERWVVWDTPPPTPGYYAELQMHMVEAHRRIERSLWEGTFTNAAPEPERAVTATELAAQMNALYRELRQDRSPRYYNWWSGSGWDMAAPLPAGGSSVFRGNIKRINEVPNYKALNETHRLVSSDDTGRLFHVFIPTIEGRPYRAYVDVVNPTPHKDGSLSQHFIGVPPEMKTAREAVAWTYGLSADEYELELRT